MQSIKDARTNICKAQDALKRSMRAHNLTSLCDCQGSHQAGVGCLGQEGMLMIWKSLKLLSAHDEYASAEQTVQLSNGKTMAAENFWLVLKFPAVYIKRWREDDKVVIWWLASWSSQAGQPPVNHRPRSLNTKHVTSVTFWINWKESVMALQWRMQGLLGWEKVYALTIGARPKAGMTVCPWLWLSLFSQLVGILGWPI